MRAVLYTEDFEPITVLELNALAMSYLDARENVNLAIYPAMPTLPYLAELPVLEGPRYVTIWREKFVRNRREAFLLFTRDDENALLLKSAFLPGQLAAVRNAERSAFARGFLTAIARLGEE